MTLNLDQSTVYTILFEMSLTVGIAKGNASIGSVALLLKVRVSTSIINDSSEKTPYVYPPTSITESLSY